MSPIVGIFASANTTLPGAFESISTISGDGSATTLTFSNIPSGYQHLQIRFIAKHTSSTLNANQNINIRINGNTGSNYSSHNLVGNGSTVSVGGSANATNIQTRPIVPSSATGLASMFGVGIIDIHDYLSTSKNKTVRIITGCETNRTSAPVGIITLESGLFFATPAAITSIDLIAASSLAFTTTTQFALYGIKGV